MEVKIEKLPNSKIKLIVTVSPKEMASYFNKAYESIAKTVKLDGFRPGKAPRTLIESSAGITRILSEGLDLAVSESYYNAIRDNKIIPITQPNIVINKYPNYGISESEIKESFEFEAELEALPEVILGDYTKLKVEPAKVKPAAEEDIEKVLKHFQKQSASFKEKEGEAQKGDFAEISFEGFLKKVRIDQMCSKNHPLILGENTLIPGFEDNIYGLKKGEKKTFKIKFPKDYHAKEYADKEAEFTVELLNLKEVILPELNDEFALKYGHDKFEVLKSEIKKNLEKELEENQRLETESKVLDKVLPLLKVEIPETLIDREVDRMIADFSGQISAQGINFEKYLSSMKKTQDDLKSEMRETAEKNVKVGLLLGKIVEENCWDQNDQHAGKKALDFLTETLTK